MKSVSAPFLDAVKNDYALRAVPKVVIDWNLNRYVPVTAYNSLDEQDYGYDIELFPIESIVDVERPRPRKGINKARVGTGTIASDYFANNGNGRYYVCDVDDVYKYWTSPTRSDSAGNIGDVHPAIFYQTTVAANKINIKVENCWATPQNFYIQTLDPANTTWTTVADQTSLGNSWKSRGEITLYWSGTAWGSGGRVDNSEGLPVTTNIRGVRMVVTKLQGGYKTEGNLLPTTYRIPVGTTTWEYPTNGGYSHFDLIEIAAHLEAEVSEHVISVSDRAEMSEVDILYPIGTLTSNEGTVQLSNIYPGSDGIGLFSKRNTDPSIPWRDYLEPNAEVTVTYDFYDEEGDFMGNIPQFVGYTEGWAGQDTDVVSVSLLDFSKYFNAVNVRAAMWENLTVPQIIWRVLDSVGFVNYQIDRDADRVTEHQIPVYYVTDDQTVWEVLDDLARASQTAIYFDSTGKLQVKTRDFAFSATDAPVWRFTSVPDAGYAPNVIEADQDMEYEPNYVRVIYQKTNWSDWNNGQPSMQMVWQPDGTEVVRASPLVRTLPVDANAFHLGSGEVDVWPHSGKVNIQGEIISYDAKQLVYYTSSNVGHTVWVSSADEQKEKTDLTPPGLAHLNYLTGAMRITERGVWNSEAKRHSVDAEGYSVHGRVGHAYQTNVGGFSHQRNESKVTLSAPGRVLDVDDWVCATQSSDANFYHYGTKMRFVPGGGIHQKAGLVICGGPNERGYYIELTPSAKLAGAELAARKELHIYSRDGAGGAKRVEPVGGRRIDIGENIDYEIDVYHMIYGGPSGPQKINVWINGKSVINITVPADAGIPLTGKFGMFIRGKSTAKYEYLYAIGRGDIEPPDEFGFLDKVDRGYTGSQWDREWTHRWRTQNRRVKKSSRKEKLRWNAQFFDEFGPYVHEIKEYDVTFDPAPVLHSRIYMSNDWGAAVLEYAGTPHGGKFIIANTSRQNSVINGDDGLSFVGTDQSVQQILAVLGRALIVEEAEEVIAKNDLQIRRRGRIESELTSPWIQTRHMAMDLSRWISTHWSYGDSNVTIKAMGNPLLQIGDVVTLNYPEKYINGTFFVVGIDTSWDDGLTSTFSLRRRS